MVSETTTVQAGEVPAVFPPPGLSLADPDFPPPGLSLADPDVKAPIVIELEDCLPHGEPRGVVLQLDDCLLESKVPTKAKLFLDLESSILDEKMPPPSLDIQLGEMTAQITALKTQMDEMVCHTGVSSMKNVLKELTAKCEEVRQSVDQIDPADTIAVPTPLKTALSSKAAPFQPFMSSTWSPQANWQNDDSIGYGFISL